MAEHSKIEWTDATWNIVTGCSVVSPGCRNCYAMKWAGTRLKLIEAAAHQVPLVTTRLAARGLDCIDAETAWLADEPAPFADAVLAALADPATRRRRAELARQRAHLLHDRVQVVAGLARVFADMLQTDNAAQGHR